ncbi:MAG: glutathione S-transferase family protein [Gammaproteobacteria bacterium]|nr:glutathione S-transferase family protein [Gammaproteobacteria bacterium]
MRLFDFHRAPNPRRVRIFIAEKGIEVPLVNVNLFQMEQLTPEFRAINPGGTVPVLETDDGLYITECIAICRYLETLHPEPCLFGKGASAEAQVLMWNGIIEHEGFHAVAEMLRNWSPGFRNRVFPGPQDIAQMPELIERGRKRSAQFFDRCEQRLLDSQFIAGDRFSVADIALLTLVDFSDWVELDVRASRPDLDRWYQGVSGRPSMGA